MTSIMLGITTYNRPSYLDKCLRSVAVHVAPIVDQVLIHNDGSDLKYNGEYGRAYKRLPTATLQIDPLNYGVAHAKNDLLQQMLDDGADWLFLMEDDIRAADPRAITYYINSCEWTGNHHLAFAHHGPANASGAVETGAMVTFYPHAVGAFSIYSRESLLAVGLHDERLKNAWEHCELTMRLIVAGYCPEAAAYKFPDATGSEAWLAEIPGSIQNSSIRPRDDWQLNISRGLRVWRDEHTDTYEMMFGPYTPLESWASQILQGSERVFGSS